MEKKWRLPNLRQYHKINIEDLEKPQKYEPIITACVLKANSDTAGYGACY